MAGVRKRAARVHCAQWDDIPIPLRERVMNSLLDRNMQYTSRDAARDLESKGYPSNERTVRSWGHKIKEERKRRNQDFGCFDAVKKRGNQKAQWKNTEAHKKANRGSKIDNVPATQANQTTEGVLNSSMETEDMIRNSVEDIDQDMSEGQEGGPSGGGSSPEGKLISPRRVRTTGRRWKLSICDLPWSRVSQVIPLVQSGVIAQRKGAMLLGCHPCTLSKWMQELADQNLSLKEFYDMHKTRERDRWISCRDARQTDMTQRTENPISLGDDPISTMKQLFEQFNKLASSVVARAGRLSEPGLLTDYVCNRCEQQGTQCNEAPKRFPRRIRPEPLKNGKAVQRKRVRQPRSNKVKRNDKLMDLCEAARDDSDEEVEYEAEFDESGALHYRVSSHQ